MVVAKVLEEVTHRQDNQYGAVVSALRIDPRGLAALTSARMPPITLPYLVTDAGRSV